MKQLSSCDAIKNTFTNVYNRVPTDNANCGVVHLKDEKKEIKNEHSQWSYGGDMSWHQIVVKQRPSCITKIVRLVARAISRK